VGGRVEPASTLRGAPCGADGLTLPDRLLCLAAEQPGAPALLDTEGAALSYEELLGLAAGMASVLSGRLGLQPGGSVALAPLNKAEAVAALYAAWLAGLEAVVVDAAGPAEDLEFQLSMRRPAVLLTHEGLEGRHCPAAERLGARCVGFEWLARAAREAPRPPPGGLARPRPWDVAVVYFYAGVAGRTLPVLHTHAGLAASAAVTAAHYGLGPGDRSFASAPVSHALGLQISTLAALYAGASAVLYTKRGRLDPRHAAEALASSAASIVLGAPGFYQALLDAGYRGHRGLRYAVSAGAPLPRATQEQWLRATGVELLQLYGMTEAAPLTATLPGDNPAGSIGRPMPGVELRLVDPETLSGAGRGPGEALARAPHVMAGYGDPGATGEALLPGGWLRTGDILEADEEGHLYFRGVRKRMLKYKGYPIFPRDIELLLEQHPAVARAEVYPVETPHGQAPGARLWLRPGARASAEEIMEWANRRLAGYKRIREVRVVATGGGEEGG